jgi:hypothetical protein
MSDGTELVGETDAEIEAVVETASDVVDDNGSLLTEAAEAGRRKRHEELTLADPNETDYQKVAHKINREVRDAVETTVFEGVLDSDEIPAETQLTPEAVDKIRTEANEAAEPVVAFVSLESSDVADRLGDGGDPEPVDDTPSVEDWDNYRTTTGGPQ